MIGSREADRQYQRGMVLGLTMAEIMLLLIFLLLLLLAAKLVADSELLAEAERQRDDAVAAQIDTEQKYAFLEPILSQLKLKEKSTYDILQEWQKKQDKFADAERQVAEAKSAMELLEPVKKDNPGITNEDAKKEIERLAAIGREMEQQAKAFMPAAEPEAAIDHLKKAAEVGDGIMKSGKSPEDLLASAASCGKELKQCNANYSQLATISTTGTKPSCWVDPETKKPQYIFTAYLKDDGIYLRDNKVPGREAEQAGLPIAPLQFESAYEPREFTSAGQPIYAWSDGRDPSCRFYVRIEDQTGGDKDRYKRLYNGVSNVFYPYDPNRQL